MPSLKISVFCTFVFHFSNVVPFTGLFFALNLMNKISVWLNSIRHNENTTKTYSNKYFQRQQSERNETISIGIGTAKRETDKPIFVCVRLCVCDKIKSFGRLFLKKEKNFSAYTMAWQSSLNGVEFKRGWWRVKTKRMPSHIPFVNSFLFKE